uniref:Uncharacterized protein n=1 Tax=Anguilla anguilla TaxID=7936 RepID=A0A0E9XQD3_ANGAN
MICNFLITWHFFFNIFFNGTLYGTCWIGHTDIK